MCYNEETACWSVVKKMSITPWMMCSVHLLATFYSQTLHPSVIISSSQDLIKIASSLHYEFRNQTMKFEMSVLNREPQREREREMSLLVFDTFDTRYI